MREVIGSAPGRAADQTVMRRQNLSFALRQLRDGGPQSRARLADATRLNKATISSLVTELVDRGLVVEGDHTRGEVGRPAQAVRLSGARICGLGAEFSAGYVAVTGLDLDRQVLSQRQTALSGPDASPEEAVDALATLVRAAVRDVAPRTIAGLTVAVPGLVEFGTGRLLHAPNLGWTRVPLASPCTSTTRPTSLRSPRHGAARAFATSCC
jgi:hypothetical protein